MTTTTVPRPIRDSTATVLLTGPRYVLTVSTDVRLRRAAQRLRRRVFAAEPGFGLPDDGDTDLDADRFDDFCDHLLVHELATGHLVGCYRMLTPAAAVRAGGYYTATEFDVTRLDPFGSSAVEMGRACVDPAHRSGAVLTLMWAGILRYLETTGHDRVFGCVSVPMRTHRSESPGANVRGVRDLLLARHAVEPAGRVTPHRPVRVDGRGLDDIAPPQRVSVPPLLRGYLRLGARICGEPAHDPDFGVADFVAILTTADANLRYLDRLRDAAERAGGPAGVPTGIPA